MIAIVGYRIFAKTATIGLLFFLMCLHFQTSDSYAQSAIFEIQNIQVDATADSAAKARDKALAEGQKKAFTTLLRRLTLREHHGFLPTPDSNTVSTYINDFSVSDEKTSSVRYLAKLHARFKSSDIRLLLSEFGLPFAETISTPVVAIPVLERGGKLTLWEDTNIWRKIWHQLNGENGLVPLIHPKGDLNDKTTIGAQHAIDGDEERLQTIAKQYNAGAALVVHASLRLSADGDMNILDINITRYGAGGNGKTQTMTLSQPATESVSQLLARGVGDAGRFVEDSWKRDNLMAYGDRGVIAVSVPFSDLKTWLSIQKRIENIAIIEHVDVILLSRDEARLNLHFMGSSRQLELAMEQTSLKLRQNEGVWYINPTQ
ncbi:MAG: DUF2066 domain-containing protein [Rhodospirillales bacterium]|nr:DUF2066 domain-containing protein [Rhodospirillales bacterium]